MSWTKYLDTLSINESVTESKTSPLTLEDIKNAKGNWSSIDGTSGALTFKEVTKDNKDYLVIDEEEVKEYHVYDIISYETVDNFEKDGGDIDEYYTNHVASGAVYDPSETLAVIDYDENRDTSADDWDPEEFDKENLKENTDEEVEEPIKENPDPINPSPGKTGDQSTDIDISKINVPQLNQLKQLVAQKDQLDKRIALLKKQISAVKESADLKEDVNPDAELISLFNELNKMEKRHARIFAQIQSQLNKEKEELHSKIKEITGRTSEDLSAIKDSVPVNTNESVSFKRYFADTTYRSSVDSVIEALTESEKIKITNKIISKKTGDIINESVIPDQSILLDVINHYGQQNFKCRFIAEAFEMKKLEERSASAKTESVITEMAVRAPKKAFILKWKDGVKTQQYLYPYDPADKKSKEAAKTKSLEAAEKKIQLKKNDVRVEDGMTGELISGNELKLGRTTGTTKVAKIAKDKKEAATSKFLLINFKKSSSKAEAEKKKDLLMKIIPELVKGLKSPKTDILDFEDEMSAKHKIDIMLSLYKTEKDTMRNQMISARANLGSAIVDMKTGKLNPVKEFEAKHGTKVDYDKEVYKNDEMLVINDKLVKKPTDEQIAARPEKKEKKSPSDAQKASREKFVKTNRGLDSKTAKFTRTGVKESVGIEDHYAEMKSYLI